MRKRKRVLKPLAIIFMLMFFTNMAVMRLFFGINVLGVMQPSMMGLTEGGGSQERDTPPESGESLNTEVVQEREMSPTREARKEEEQKAEVAQKESAPEPAGTESTISHYVIPSDPIAALQNLNFADKLFVLSILPKIGREGMDRLIELSDDGLVSDEYEEIKMLAENCLKPSDIEKLKEIFDKNKGLFARNPGE